MFRQESKVTKQTTPFEQQVPLNFFKLGVPEKIIKERTGHRSLEALRVYERTTCEQLKAVSTILSADKNNIQAGYRAAALRLWSTVTTSVSASMAQSRWPALFAI